MATLQIRDVPDDVLRVLRARAKESDRSLQAYARAVLAAEARQLSPREAMERAKQISSRTTVTTDDIIEALDEARRSRDA